MKKWIFALLAAMLVMICMTGAMAEDMVSISELYDQAQAMGGWWKETFDTPNGEVTVDAPIIVPDVETMPVITVEVAKISEELYNQIIQGKKVGNADAIRYDEVEIDGKVMEFFLGYENDYIFGEQTDVTGYDAVDILWTYHGGYTTGSGEHMGSAEKQAQPTTFHFPWEIDADTACVRESDITLNEAMRLWHEDLALCYPGEEITIRPTRIKLRGSTLTSTFVSGKPNKRNGYLVIEGAEQLINGIPLIGAIDECDVFGGGASAELNRIEDKLNVYRVGCDSVATDFYGNFTDENNYRTCNSLARVRTTEYADVPLASLDSVLENVTKEIEAGNIRRIFSIKLGYEMYSNPEMTDYAWAVPRWEVECDYVMKEQERKIRYNPEPENDGEQWIWGSLYYAQLPIDAQSGEPIIFTYGDEKNAEVYSVPEIMAWDEL